MKGIKTLAITLRIESIHDLIKSIDIPRLTATCKKETTIMTAFSSIMIAGSLKQATNGVHVMDLLAHHLIWWAWPRTTWRLMRLLLAFSTTVAGRFIILTGMNATMSLQNLLYFVKNNGLTVKVSQSLDSLIYERGKARQESKCDAWLFQFGHPKKWGKDEVHVDLWNSFVKQQQNRGKEWHQDPTTGLQNCPKRKRPRAYVLHHRHSRASK